jgi:hypothetical protein
LALVRDGEGDNGHFAHGPDFADLADAFDNPLRTRLEAGSREEAVRSQYHKVEILAARFVSEFVNASGSGSINAGAIVADVQDHYFNQVANTAIRIAN